MESAFEQHEGRDHAVPIIIRDVNVINEALAALQARRQLSCNSGTSCSEPILQNIEDKWWHVESITFCRHRSEYPIDLLHLALHEWGKAVAAVRLILFKGT